MFQSLFYPIQSKFLDTVNTLCGRIPQVFLKQIEKTMRKEFEAKVVRHIGHAKWLKGAELHLQQHADCGLEVWHQHLQDSTGVLPFFM